MWTHSLLHFAGTHFEIKLNDLHPVIETGREIRTFVQISFSGAEGSGLKAGHHADSMAIPIAQRPGESYSQQALPEMLVER